VISNDTVEEDIRNAAAAAEYAPKPRARPSLSTVTARADERETSDHEAKELLLEEQRNVRRAWAMNAVATAKSHSAEHSTSFTPLEGGVAWKIFEVLESVAAQ
jgi:hypothetical protein